MIVAAESQVEDEPKQNAEQATDFAAFDIETGPLPDEVLRAIYHEKTFEEFAETCDQRWKPETKAAKYEEHKATAWQTFVDKAALDASTGRVVAIGVNPCPLEGVGPSILDCDGDSRGISDELSGLKMFWQWVAANLADQRPMVGFNIHGFDLPFLVRRSWILGVPVPAGVRQGRYWNPIFIDLMKVWAFDQREYISLDAVAAAFGVGQKVKEVDGVAVSGAEFHRLWRENRPVAEKYLMQDLRLPAVLAERMGVV